MTNVSLTQTSLKKLNWHQRLACCLVLLFSMALQPALAESPAFLKHDLWKKNIATLSKQPEQVVVVQAGQTVRATIELWERKDNADWQLTGGPWAAVMGKNGMAAPAQKREGDGKTPSGLFPISFAFGESAQLTTGLEYRMATDQDIWIDDTSSPLYNQWSKLPTQARSFEKMKRNDMLFDILPALKDEDSYCV